MRMIGPVAVEIHDEVLFAPGGQIRKWSQGVAISNTKNTKTAAPLNKRTRKFPGNPPRGTLKRLISSNVKMEGPKVIGIETRSDAPYSVYVIKGTHTQWSRDVLGRFTDAARGFALPSNNYGRYRHVQRVRGQKANNFLVKGLAKTAIRHPALGGAKFRTWG